MTREARMAIAIWIQKRSFFSSIIKQFISAFTLLVFVFSQNIFVPLYAQDGSQPVADQTAQPQIQEISAEDAQAQQQASASGQITMPAYAPPKEVSTQDFMTEDSALSAASEAEVKEEAVAEDLLVSKEKIQRAEISPLTFPLGFISSEANSDEITKSILESFQPGDRTPGGTPVLTSAARNENQDLVVSIGIKSSAAGPITQNATFTMKDFQGVPHVTSSQWSSPENVLQRSETFSYTDAGQIGQYRVENFDAQKNPTSTTDKNFIAGQLVKRVDQSIGSSGLSQLTTTMLYSGGTLVRQNQEYQDSEGNFDRSFDTSYVNGQAVAGFSEDDGRKSAYTSTYDDKGKQIGSQSWSPVEMPIGVFSDWYFENQTVSDPNVPGGTYQYGYRATDGELETFSLVVGDQTVYAYKTGVSWMDMNKQPIADIQQYIADGYKQLGVTNPINFIELGVPPMPSAPPVTTAEIVQQQMTQMIAQTSVELKKYEEKIADGKTLLTAEDYAVIKNSLIKLQNDLTEQQKMLIQAQVQVGKTALMEKVSESSIMEGGYFTYYENLPEYFNIPGYEQIADRARALLMSGYMEWIQERQVVTDQYNTDLGLLRQKLFDAANAELKPKLAEFESRFSGETQLSMEEYEELNTFLSTINTRYQTAQNDYNAESAILAQNLQKSLEAIILSPEARQAYGDAYSVAKTRENYLRKGIMYINEINASVYGVEDYEKMSVQRTIVAPQFKILTNGPSAKDELVQGVENLIAGKTITMQIGGAQVTVIPSKLVGVLNEEMKKIYSLRLPGITQEDIDFLGTPLNYDLQTGRKLTFHLIERYGESVIQSGVVDREAFRTKLLGLEPAPAPVPVFKPMTAAELLKTDFTAMDRTQAINLVKTAEINDVDIMNIFTEMHNQMKLTKEEVVDIVTAMNAARDEGSQIADIKILANLGIESIPEPVLTPVPAPIKFIMPTVPAAPPVIAKTAEEQDALTRSTIATALGIGENEKFDIKQIYSNDAISTNMYTKEESIDLIYRVTKSDGSILYASVSGARVADGITRLSATERVDGKYFDKELQTQTIKSISIAPAPVPLVQTDPDVMLEAPIEVEPTAALPEPAPIETDRDVTLEPKLTPDSTITPKLDIIDVEPTSIVPEPAPIETDPDVILQANDYERRLGESAEITQSDFQEIMNYLDTLNNPSETETRENLVNLLSRKIVVVDVAGLKVKVFPTGLVKIIDDEMNNLQDGAAWLPGLTEKDFEAAGATDDSLESDLRMVIHMVSHYGQVFVKDGEVDETLFRQWLHGENPEQTAIVLEPDTPEELAAPDPEVMETPAPDLKIMDADGDVIDTEVMEPSDAELKVPDESTNVVEPEVMEPSDTELKVPDESTNVVEPEVMDMPAAEPETPDQSTVPEPEVIEEPLVDTAAVDGQKEVQEMRSLLESDHNKQITAIGTKYSEKLKALQNKFADESEISLEDYNGIEALISDLRSEYETENKNYADGLLKLQKYASSKNVIYLSPIVYSKERRGSAYFNDEHRNIENGVNELLESKSVGLILKDGSTLHVNPELILDVINKTRRDFGVEYGVEGQQLQEVPGITSDDSKGIGASENEWGTLNQRQNRRIALNVIQRLGASVATKEGLVSSYELRKALLGGKPFENVTISEDADGNVRVTVKKNFGKVREAFIAGTEPAFMTMNAKDKKIKIGDKSFDISNRDNVVSALQEITDNINSNPLDRSSAEGDWRLVIEKFQDFVKNNSPATEKARDVVAAFRASLSSGGASGIPAERPGSFSSVERDRQRSTSSLAERKANRMSLFELWQKQKRSKSKTRISGFDE